MWRGQGMYRTVSVSRQKECVGKRQRWADVETERPPDAGGVSHRCSGFPLRHCLVPMRPTARLADVLATQAKDFLIGRNGERGEIASSAFGWGKEKRLILTDKTPTKSNSIMRALLLA